MANYRVDTSNAILLIKARILVKRNYKDKSTNYLHKNPDYLHVILDKCHL